MKVFKGTGVFASVAIGKIHYYSGSDSSDKVVRKEVSDLDAEMVRFEKAKTAAIARLEVLYNEALTKVDEEHASIFEIHQMMMNDDDYCDEVKDRVYTEKVSAEYAVKLASDKFSEMFAAMDDEYMQERAADVKDISNRLIKLLLGKPETEFNFSSPIILAAEDLVPSETIQLDKNMILAFVTRGGSTSSHTAILARMMGIPAIIGAEEISPDVDGKDAIVDGFTGEIYIEPDGDTLNRLKKKAQEEAENKKRLEAFRGKDNISLDGKRIDVFANIGSVDDTIAALENDAGGVGLFRSEFLYLHSSDYPTEEEQFIAYKTVAQKMAGKKVVIRTLDIGADKQIDYFDLPKEQNPAMGFRAIRICLERPEIFKTQLRAILRASAFGKIAIMFPMIISVEEVKDCKEILNAVKAELDASKTAYDKNIEIGVMIETPAAVMISDLLAKEVDFFSVGTNDLTQYTLALDRQNPKLDRFFNPHHKAIIRMIKMAADNIHKEGKWIGICGELASDLDLTEVFLAIGIDELSVSPPYILPLRAKVCETKVRKGVLDVF